MTKSSLTKNLNPEQYAEEMAEHVPNRVKKSEEAHYKLSELLKFGATIAINVEGVSNGTHNVGVSLVMAGNGKGLEGDTPDEQAANVLALGIQKVLERVMPDIVHKGATIAAENWPDLSVALTGHTEEELKKIDEEQEEPAGPEKVIDLIVNALAAASTGQPREGCDCPACTRKREEMAEQETPPENEPKH